MSCATLSCIQKRPWRGYCGKNRLKLIKILLLSSYHNARTVSRPSRPSAHSCIKEMDAPPRQDLGAAYRIFIKTISSVHNCVPTRKQRDKFLKKFINAPGTHHNPKHTWL